MRFSLDRKLDTIERKLERQDKAIRTMAYWLYQCRSGFGLKDVEGIERILDTGHSTPPPPKPPHEARPTRLEKGELS